MITLPRVVALIIGGCRFTVNVFHHHSASTVFTSEGEDLLRRARQLLSDVESLGERARALKSGQTGVLRLGATPQVLDPLLAGFLPRYRRRHPGVEVHLVQFGGASAAERLERGDVHVSLLPAGDARFRWRPLLPMYLLAVLPKSHRLARRTTLEIDDLVDTPLLLTRRDFASRG